MSHTRDYARSEEYEDLLNFCKKHGKALWPLLFTSFKKGNLFLVNIYKNLIHPGREDLMDEVKREFDSNRYTADGTYIVYSMESEWRKFCRKVLEREFN